MSVPVVAIIGRPNVGKSTFFNRVLGERRAVVHDRPGITRDRNAARAEWAGRAFLLVDTGGFLPAARPGDQAGTARDTMVRRQAEIAIGLASVVLFMVDAKTGLTDLDGAIANGLLRRHAGNCILVVNKVDQPGDPVVHEFHALGLGDPFGISSENGTSIGDLLDRVIAMLPAERAAAGPAPPRIAIVGRPNVGKSSLVNALLREERMIVEPRPGTTMDAVDSAWSTKEGEFTLVDTAGIRHESRYDDDPEFYAAMRSLKALERADVAGLVVDATQGFQTQEARLAHEALDAGCSLLLLYNKWDLVTEREAEWKRLNADRGRRYPTLQDLPSAPVSALVRTHLHRLPSLLAQRVADHRRKIPTPKINAWLEDVQRRRGLPSTKLGRTAKVYYATQTGIGPPEITLFVNEPARFTANYRRFVWTRLAEHFGFRGVPLRLRVRKSD
jgi:GTP-binding protein